MSWLSQPMKKNQSRAPDIRVTSSQGTSSQIGAGQRAKQVEGGSWTGEGNELAPTRTARREHASGIGDLMQFSSMVEMSSTMLDSKGLVKVTNQTRSSHWSRVEPNPPESFRFDEEDALVKTSVMWRNKPSSRVIWNQGGLQVPVRETAEAIAQTSPQAAEKTKSKRRDKSIQVGPQLFTRETNTSVISSGRRCSASSSKDLLDLNDSTYSVKPNKDLIGLGGHFYGYGTPLLATPAFIRTQEARTSPLRNIQNTPEQKRRSSSTSWGQERPVESAYGYIKQEPSYNVQAGVRTRGMTRGGSAQNLVGDQGGQGQQGAPEANRALEQAINRQFRLNMAMLENMSRIQRGNTLSSLPKFKRGGIPIRMWLRMFLNATRNLPVEDRTQRILSVFEENELNEVYAGIVVDQAEWEDLEDQLINLFAKNDTDRIEEEFRETRKEENESFAKFGRTTQGPASESLQRRNQHQRSGAHSNASEGSKGHAE